MILHANIKIMYQLKSLSHHAYLLIGDSNAQNDIIHFLEKSHHISTKGNPDLFNRAYNTFTIDDSRELKIRAGVRPMSVEKKKIFILHVNNIHIEAQNALLKLLEEPPEYAHFFLIVPSAHILLPTVKSRMQELRLGDKETAPSHVPRSHPRGHTSTHEATPPLTRATIVQDFIYFPTPKRLDYIKRLLDDISNEKKTIRDAIDFLNEIEIVIYASIQDSQVQSQALKKAQTQLQAIQTARTYIHDRAPSLKMLLEYVAVNV